MTSSILPTTSTATDEVIKVSLIAPIFVTKTPTVYLFPGYPSQYLFCMHEPRASSTARLVKFSEAMSSKPLICLCFSLRIKSYITGSFCSRGWSPNQTSFSPFDLPLDDIVAWWRRKRCMLTVHVRRYTVLCHGQHCSVIRNTVKFNRPALIVHSLSTVVL